MEAQEDTTAIYPPPVVRTYQLDDGENVYALHAPRMRAVCIGEGTDNQSVHIHDVVDFRVAVDEHGIVTVSFVRVDGTEVDVYAYPAR